MRVVSRLLIIKPSPAALAIATFAEAEPFIAVVVSRVMAPPASSVQPAVSISRLGLLTRLVSTPIP